MKKLKFSPVSFLLLNILMLVAVFFIYSCSESDDKIGSTTKSPYKCLDCKTQSEARAENDNSYKGIYLGIGTRGSVVVDINNRDETFTSKMTIDGVPVNFIAKDIVADNGLYVANFDGNYNNAPISFKFSVEEDGSNPKISSDYFADKFYVSKETSGNMLEVFEGEYNINGSLPAEARIPNTDDDSTFVAVGKYHMVISRFQNGKMPWWQGVSKIDSKLDFHNGLINGSNQMVDEGNRLIGTLSSDELNGMFVNEFDKKIYLTSRRKL